MSQFNAFTLSYKFPDDMPPQVCEAVVSQMIYHIRDCMPNNFDDSSFSLTFNYNFVNFTK